GGYFVPAGTDLQMSQWVVHRDPRWYENPLEFRPERWADGLEKRIPKYAYFPFGGGPRMCIGNNFALMEAPLILATVAQKYRLRVLEEPVLEPSITLRPKHGLKVRLERARRKAQKL
ncbi:MAG: cytochrome P450, partial [Meiothermus sp.]